MADEQTAAADLSVSEAAAYIGVTRARVYQRLTGYAGAWDAGRPLNSIVRDTGRPGTRNGRQKRIAIEDALAWRTEREQAGLPVGPVTPTILAALGAALNDPIATAPTVGLPAITPF